MPQIKEIKKEMMKLGFDGALMSGSGSCVLVLLEIKKLWIKDMNSLENVIFLLENRKF